MKKILIFIITFWTIFAAGCMDIIEEITLNKDGSGVFSYTIDMGRAISMGLMEQLRAMGGGEDGSGEIERVEVDTMVNIFDSFSEEQLETVENPKFWKKVNLKTQMSESKGLGLIQFTLNFDDVKEIDYFMSNLKDVQGGTDGGGLAGLSSLMTGGSNTKAQIEGLFKLNKRKITRSKGSQTSIADDPEMGEQMGMLAMMLADAKYRTIYHLPGKVKKATNTNAKVSDDQKTVTVEVNLLDYMKNEASLENTVSFKKK